jgi:hypothetical protein
VRKSNKFWRLAALTSFRLHEIVEHSVLGATRAGSALHQGKKLKLSANSGDYSE